MTKKTISKILQIVAILTFTLPFFYTGCGTSKKQEAKAKAQQDSVLADSIAKAEKYSCDSIVKATDSIANYQNKIKQDNSDSTLTSGGSINTKIDNGNQEKNNKDEQPTDKIVAQYPFLSFILKPTADTYSGFGTVINEISLIVLFSLCVSLLLLLIGLLIKFIEPNALKSIVIIDVMILLGIWISRSPSWNSDKLWGFWVCLSVTGLLLIYDLYVAITKKR